MIQKSKSKWFVFVFIIGLLIFAVTIQSDVIVDRSFLPRFILTFLLLLLVWVARFRKSHPGPFNLFILAFILLYVWNLLSCLWALSVPEALMQSQLVFLGLVIFLTVSDLVTEDARVENIFIKVLFFTLVYSFGLSLYKMYTIAFFDPYKILSISANNNLYAGFLLLSLPFLVTGYLKNTGIWKYLLWLAGIATVFFILILQSRAVYIGLLISICIVVLFVAFRYRNTLTKRNLIISMASTLLLIACCIIFYHSLDTTRKYYFINKLAVFNYVPILTDKDYSIKKDSLELAGDSSGKAPAFDLSADYYQNANLRVIFWKKSLGLIQMKPLAGVGAGNWKINVASVANPPNPEHMLKNYTYSQPHNEWICLLAELGITGFILSLMVFILPLIILFKRIAFNKSKPGISVLIYASFITGFYAYSVFDFPLRRVEPNILFFSLMAFLFNKEPLPSFNFGRTGNIQARVFPAIIILLLLFSIWVSAERVKGEYFTFKVFRNERKNDANVIKYCRLGENQFYDITPNTLPLEWFKGVAFFRLGNNDSANNCFINALQITPYEVRVLNDYGASLYQMEKLKEAKTVFRQCYALDPYFDDAKFNLAAIYYYDHQKDSARFYVNTCRKSQKKADFLKELN